MDQEVLALAACPLSTFLVEASRRLWRPLRRSAAARLRMPVGAIGIGGAPPGAGGNCCAPGGCMPGDWGGIPPPCIGICGTCNCGGGFSLPSRPPRSHCAYRPERNPSLHHWCWRHARGTLTAHWHTTAGKATGRLYPEAGSNRRLHRSKALHRVARRHHAASRAAAWNRQ